MQPGYKFHFKVYASVLFLNGDSSDLLNGNYSQNLTTSDILMHWLVYLLVDFYLFNLGSKLQIIYLDEIQLVVSDFYEYFDQFKSYELTEMCLQSILHQFLVAHVFLMMRVSLQY